MPIAVDPGSTLDLTRSVVPDRSSAIEATRVDEPDPHGWTPPPFAVVVDRPRRSPVGWIAVAALGVAGLMLAGWWLTRPIDPRPDLPSPTAAAPGIDRATTEPPEPDPETVATPEPETRLAAAPTPTPTPIPATPPEPVPIQPETKPVPDPEPVKLANAAAPPAEVAAEPKPERKPDPPPAAAPEPIAAPRVVTESVPLTEVVPTTKPAEPAPAAAPKAKARPAPPVKPSGPPPPRSLSSTVGIRLVRIEPGTFMMGTPDGDPEAMPAEQPWHPVKITRAYYLADREVTQAQYRTVTGASPSFHAPTGRGAPQMKGQDTASRPVENVSWFEAAAFCNALSKKEGLPPYYRIEGKDVTILGGRGYRLPTEAEWEFACRAGTKTRFASGDDPERLARVANIADAQLKRVVPSYETIKADDGHPFTAPVGARSPNAWGLYDLHGNVREWCQGWYGEYPYAFDEDYDGPDAGTLRMIRGGSFNDQPKWARSSCRVGGDPDLKSEQLGFRVARTLD